MKKKLIYKLYFFLALCQLVILFDVTIAPKKDKQKGSESVQLLNSIASTYIHFNSSDIEVDTITVIIHLYKQIKYRYIYF